MTPRAEAGTRALLDAFAEGDPAAVLPLGEVFAGLGKRSFGMLLFIATLPAFIPIPGFAGAISGPLVILIGVQLLLGLRNPWLPAFIARRGPHREMLVKVRDRIGPWLERLEHAIKPRAAALLDHRAASAFTGLLLILLGLLLSLPIPFTNFVFAALLLMFSLALLERDGRLMFVAWVSGVATCLAAVAVSGSVVAMLAPWVDRLF